MGKVKLILSAAGSLFDEDGRRRLVWIALIVPILICMIIMLFVYLVSGLLGFIASANVRDNWNVVRNNILDIFQSINYTIDRDIKNEVYAYMPDFSVNLSKAAISEKYPNGLLIYDTEELEAAQLNMSSAADAIRKVNESGYAELMNSYGIDDFPQYSDIAADNAFITDIGIAGYSDYLTSTRQLLEAVAMLKMKTYTYECKDYKTADNRSGHIQRLTVVQEDGTTKTVEYNCIGEVAIFLPDFLALYQTRLLELSLSDENTTYSDMEKASSVLEDVNTEEELIETVNDFYGSEVKSTLGLMQIADLASIIRGALNGGNIAIQTTYDYYDDGSSKLTVFLSAPNSEEWSEIFGITEEQEQTVNDFKAVIEQQLTDSDVPESDFWISLDDMFQAALFVYFEGFFNLPVEASELRPNTNGIITTLGEYQEIHRHGSSPAFEEGVTLDIAEKDTPIRIELLPSVGSKCISDIVIYDVWIAENNSGAANNCLYNSDAVTVAYYIDTDLFKSTYGFDFPSPSRAFDVDGTVTMLVEYSCLSSLMVDESYIGCSILDDIEKGDYVIGYCHDGAYKNSDLVYTSNFNSYYHDYTSVSDNETPHISIKIDFYESELQAANDNGYSGLSGHIYNCRANPLLWFKSFRTETLIPAGEK